MNFREFLELNESRTLKDVERFFKKEGVKYSVQTFLNGTFKVSFADKNLSALFDGDIIDVTSPNKKEQTLFLKSGGLTELMDLFHSL